jgi:hypothetical protein
MSSNQTPLKPNDFPVQVDDKTKSRMASQLRSRNMQSPRPMLQNASTTIKGPANKISGLLNLVRSYRGTGNTKKWAQDSGVRALI